MNAKKLLALLLAVVMILATASACAKPTEDTKSSEAESSSAVESSKTEESSEAEDEKYPLLNMESDFPVTKEPFELSFVASYDSAIDVNFETGQNFWQWMERESNVKINFRLIANEAWNEQEAIILAGSDLPDVFFHPLSETKVYKYGLQQGLFIPLNEYLDDKELTPNINQVFDEKPELKAASILPDGNIYGFGYYMTKYYETASGLRAQWIREYAEAAGVDVTAIKTLDDLYDAFVAIRDSDYNGNGQADEIPFGYYNSTDVVPAWDALLQYILNAYGMVGGSGIYVDTRSDTASYAPLTEQYKAACEYLAKLYSEKLLDSATFTQTEAEFQAKGASGLMPFGIYYNCYADVPADIVTAHQENNYENDILYSPVPVVDKEGSTPVVNGDYGIGVNRCFITKACANPEVAVRWMDALFSPVGSLYFRQGPEYQSDDDIIGNGWEYDTETCTINASNMVTRSGIDNGWYMWITVCNFAMGSVGYLGSDENRGLMELHPDANSVVSNDWLSPYRENINQYEALGFPSVVYYTDEQQSFIDTYVTDLQTYVYQMTAKFITGAESFDNWDSFVEGMNSMKVSDYNDLINSIYENYKANA